MEVYNRVTSETKVVSLNRRPLPVPTPHAPPVFIRQTSFVVVNISCNFKYFTKVYGRNSVYY